MDKQPLGGPPSFSPFPMRCRRCGNRWSDQAPDHVPAEVFIRHIDGLRCPKCGARPAELSIDIGPLGRTGTVK